MRVGVLNQLTRCSTKKREKTSCISYYGFSSRIRPDYQVRTEPRTLGHTLVAVVRVYVPPAVYPCNDSLAPSFLASLIQGRMSGTPLPSPLQCSPRGLARYVIDTLSPR